MDQATTDPFAADVAALRSNAEVRAILDELCQRTDMGFAAVARVNEERWVACQVVDRIEFGLEPGDELEIKTTICDEVRRSGKAVIIDHVGADAAWRTHPVPALYGFESYASVPVVLGDGGIWGTLCTLDPAPRALSSVAIVSALEGYARRIATVLEAPDR